MAKIIKKPSALKKEYLLLTRRIKTALIFALIFVLLSIVGSLFMHAEVLFFFGITLTALSVLGFIVCLVLALARHTDATVIKHGLEGEDAAAEVIASLPKDFFGFQNVVINANGKESELDLVVVGSTGVFIIETKNRNGRITGSYSGFKWTQHKVGRGGNSYSSELYSPVKQVGTHIFRLAHYLRSAGIKVHINGVVYFSNPDTVIDISGAQGDIPIISSERALKKYILSGKSELSAQTVQTVCELLSK